MWVVKGYQEMCFTKFMKIIESTIILNYVIG